jgi:hypothetical protein
MTKKKTHEEFLNEIKNLVGDEYLILGNYETTHSPIKIKHSILKCGYEYFVIPKNFIKKNGTRCPKCFGNAKKDTTYFKNQVYQLVDNEYRVLGKYINGGSRILMKHNTCHYEYLVTPNHFVNGTRCPKCYHDSIISKDNFEEKLMNKYDKEFMPLDSFITSYVKIRFKHNIETCGTIFHRTPSHILEGRLCPCQKVKSKGESKIEDFLINNNFTYDTQFTFKDCKDVKSLPFDFAIFKDNVLMMLIEFDGEQHYKHIRFGGISEEKAKHNFETNIFRDQIKNNYCKGNRILLLRIPYWEYDRINEILCHYLKEPIENFKGSFLIS